jgi:hypothetical protein
VFYRFFEPANLRTIREPGKTGNLDAALSFAEVERISDCRQNSYASSMAFKYVFSHASTGAVGCPVQNRLLATAVPNSIGVRTCQDPFPSASPAHEKVRLPR